MIRPQSEERHTRSRQTPQGTSLGVLSPPDTPAFRPEDSGATDVASNTLASADCLGLKSDSELGQVAGAEK